MKLAGVPLWTGLLAWNRPDWLAVSGFAAVINLLMLVPTLYMLQIYDRVLVSGSQGTLLAITLITVFLFAVMAAADWFRSRLLIRIGLSLDARLAPTVFRSAYRQRLQGQPASITQHLGDLTQVRQYLTGAGFLALLDVPWVPIYVGVLFLLHPVLGFAAILFGVLQLGATWLSHLGSQGRVEQAQRASQSAENTAAQFLRASELIRAMGMGARVRRLWQERHGHAMRVEGEVDARQARWTGWSKWLRYTQQSAALGVGAWLVIRGDLTVGAMIAANVLTTRALAPLDAWAQTWGLALGAGKAFDRLKALLTSSAQEPVAVPAQHSAEINVGEVARLDQVGISFAGRPSPVLQQIDLVLRKGELVLLQGPSGSGKSTLARTLLGIVPPTQGRVMWGLGERSASDAIGYLPQSVDLFAGTVAQNIARFAEADSRKVIEAARLVGLHETIQRMPMGYDTPVGVAGHFLSGGQRQRIALARAVYGLPELVVLDEPNAQLDSSGEIALLQALAQLKRRGCAVLVISHRPGVLQVVDRVVTLAKGRVAGLARTPEAEMLEAIAA